MANEDSAAAFLKKLEAATERGPGLGSQFVSALITLSVIGAFLTVGWNYGGSDFLAALGGPDRHINYLDAVLAFITVRVLGRAVTGA